MINPEEEFGRRFANRLVNRHVISDMPLSDDLHLTELAIHPSMVGKSLIELALATFLAGLIFLRSLTHRVITPLEEIHTVMNAQRNG